MPPTRFRNGSRLATSSRSLSASAALPTPAEWEFDWEFEWEN
eukprot:COSAG02_NODE_50602_length_319_cov_1.159091_1_plen_42_part_01